MFGSKEEKMTKEEHKKKLEELMNLYVTMVEKLFDNVDQIAKTKETEIRGKKYILASSFRFQTRSLRARIIQELRKYQK